MRKRTMLIVAILATLAGLVLGSTANASQWVGKAASHFVTSKQIKDHTIKVKDLRKGTVKKLKGQTGAAGTNGVNGKAGVNGVDGLNGEDGNDGTDGVDGVDGRSAYQTWLSHHNDGTEDEFLASLIGADGTDGVDGVDGVDGTDGVDGASGTANVHVVPVTAHNDNASATCGTGEVLIGGGGEATGPDSYLVYSKPVGNTWTVKTKNSNNTTAYAICAA